MKNFFTVKEAKELIDIIVNAKPGAELIVSLVTMPFIILIWFGLLSTNWLIYLAH